MPRRAIVALLAALAAPASAQTDAAYDGTWTIAFDGRQRIDLEGTVVIAGTGGTWKIVARSSRNPCVGREYTIAVRKATADELVFEVERAKSLAGCRNGTYTFKRVDAKTLEGELGDGRAVQLKRE